MEGEVEMTGKSAGTSTHLDPRSPTNGAPIDRVRYVDDYTSRLREGGLETLQERRRSLERGLQDHGPNYRRERWTAEEKTRIVARVSKRARTYPGSHGDTEWCAGC
jgi:hypothetical protein